MWVAAYEIGGNGGRGGVLAERWLALEYKVSTGEELEKEMLDCSEIRAPWVPYA